MKTNLEIEKKIDEIRKFGKSPWVFHINTGGCNGCDIEIVDIFTPYYDVERFGIKRVSSAKHADILLVTGPVTRQSFKTYMKAYEASPDPKLIVAIGNCACGGGICHDSFTTLGGVDKVTPIDVYIPGCPPRPEALIYGILLSLGKVEQKIKESKYKEEGIDETK
jgi:Ni,Fe-hydrogenase III small subunit